MRSTNNDSDSAARDSPQFASTHWSTIRAARDSASPDSREALERLCRTYWYPLYAFVRRKGYSPADAQDLTQGFFERFLEKHYLRQIVPEQGRFRTFLLACLTRFLADERDRAQALKRGGRLAALAVDPVVLERRYGSEGDAQEPPERHFDRLWAEAVMDQALVSLEDEFKVAGKEDQFDVLADFVARSPEAGEYTRVGERLGMNSHAVAVAVARLRERCRTLVQTVIADTVQSPDDRDAELRYLVELLGR